MYKSRDAEGRGGRLDDHGVITVGAAYCHAIHKRRWFWFSAKCAIHILCALPEGYFCRDPFLSDLDALFIATNAPERSALNEVERRMAPLSRDISEMMFPQETFF